MVALRYEYQKGIFQSAFASITEPMARAATAAIDDARQLAISTGRAAIASGGFGRRWQNALQGRTYPDRPVLDPAAWITHKIPYAAVFQDGARIAGSPLLWIPLGNAPQKIGGRPMTPRVFAASVGPLHSIRAPGKPPMLAAYMRGTRPRRGKISLASLRAGAALARLGVRSRRSATGRAGVISVPIFVGVSSVQLRKRFDLRTALLTAAARVPEFYFKHLKTD